jgi:hypothetical protein
MKPTTSIGFTSDTREHEQLQDAWRSLNDALQRLQSIEVALEHLNIGQAKDYLKAAQWNLGKARKSIESIGKSGKLKS